MSKQNYYLHISSKTLANYFGSGVITPSGYIDDKPYDVQSLVKNGLLVSSIKYAKTDNCSLLIDLTEKEEGLLKTFNKAYSYFGKWLPISRVRKVLFKDDAQMKHSVYDINVSTAFIPDSLVEHVIVSKSEYAEEITDIKGLDVEIDHKKTIDFFDSVLGAICFTKIAKSDLRDKHVNCSPSFLSLCSFYSDTIKKKYLEQGGLLDEKYNAFLELNDQYPKLKEYTYSDLNRELVEDAFAHFRIGEVPYKLGSLNVNALDTKSKMYPLAIVSVYGKSGSKKDMDLVAEIYQEKISERTEGVCFMYGLHYGYKKLRNSYKTDYGLTNVKLELESRFDFELLESIYNFLLNKKGSVYNFHFDGIWSEEFQPEEFENSFDYESYNIWGSNWIPQKRNSDGILMKLIRVFTTKCASFFNDDIIKVDQLKLENQLKLKTSKLFKEELEKYSAPYIQKIKEQASTINKLKNKLAIEEKDLENSFKADKTIKPQEKSEIDLEITNKDYRVKEIYQQDSLENEVKEPATLFDKSNKPEFNLSNYEILKNKDPKQRENHLKKLNKDKLLDLCEAFNIKVHRKTNNKDLAAAILEKFEN